MHRAVLLSFFSLAACGKSLSADEANGLTPVVASSSSSAPGAPAAPPSPGQIAALDGLREGDQLASTRVTRVLGVEHGLMPILVEADGARGSFQVSLLSEKPTPPVRTAKYAIYWTMPERGEKALSEDVMMAAAEALASRLRKAEATVPPPPGVTIYKLEQKP